MPGFFRISRGGPLAPQPDGRSRSRVPLAALAALLAALTLPAGALAIDEFPIPTASSLPGGITVGPDGALWFTEENGNKIGRIHPSNPSVVNEFPIPWTASAPQEIVAGPDGALWFTAFGSNPPRIGRITTAGLIDPANGYPLPVGSAPDGITLGPDGALWFTIQGANARIGRIDPFNPSSITYSSNLSGSTPGDIKTGPDGRLWFTEAEPSNAIGALTPGTGAIIEFPRAGSGPSGIASSGASLWVTQHLSNLIEQVNPQTGGTLATFPGGSEPSGITFGPDNALWFTQTSGNKIGRMTTGGSLLEFPIPTPNSQPGNIVSGPDGALWFTENSGNKIGRIAAGSPGGGSGGGGPPPAPPTPIDTSARPSVLSLRVSPRSFRAAPRGASISGKSRSSSARRMSSSAKRRSRSAKVGGTVTYRLGSAATTRFSVQSERAGRKRGRRCQRPTRRNRRGKRCKLYKTVRGSFSHEGAAGSNRFRFTGRVRNKKLRPGRYRLVGVAAIGSARSPLRYASFRIVRR